MPRSLLVTARIRLSRGTRSQAELMGLVLRVAGTWLCQLALVLEDA